MLLSLISNTAKQLAKIAVPKPPRQVIKNVPVGNNNVNGSSINIKI